MTSSETLHSFTVIVDLARVRTPFKRPSLLFQVELPGVVLMIKTDSIPLDKGFGILLGRSKIFLSMDALFFDEKNKKIGKLLVFLSNFVLSFQGK